MSDILNSVAEVEKELTLLDGLLNHIYIFSKESNELVVRLRIGSSIDFDTQILGGLVNTIEEFAGPNTDRNLRYITLEAIKLIFLDFNDFLVVLGCDSEYPVEQFGKFMELFMESFQEGYKIQNYGKGPDGVSLSVQIIKSLLSEDIEMELILSDKANIFPYKLKELANDIIDEELKKTSSKVSSLEDGSFDDALIPLMDKDEILGGALHDMLDRFANTFSDILSVTLIHTNQLGMLERITKGNISKTLEATILDIILGMIDTVSVLLESSEEDRTLDLENHWLYFQSITLSSFIYVIVDSKDSLELVKPLVERLSNTILNLFPDEVTF